jgi:amino acid transporter
MPGEEESTASAGEPQLLRVVGFWALTAAVINLSIGGSIYVLQGTFAGTLGVAAPVVFVLGALVFIPVTMCIAAAGSRISATGGPYMYVRAAFGPLPSFVTGSVFWISNFAGAAGLAAALMDQAAQLVPSMSRPLPRGAVAGTLYFLLCALNARGIRTGAIAIIVLATVKLLPLVLLTVLGSFYVHAANFHGPSTLTWSTVGSAMVLVIFCYSGMELALSPSGEIHNPSRVVPRATLIGMATVVLLAVGLQIVAQGVLGSRLANNPAPLAALADSLLPGSYGVILLAASIAMFGILQGDLVGSSRLLYALARDGYLPSILCQVTIRRRVPLPALITHAAVVAVLATFGTFKPLVLVSGGAMSIVYIGCCAAAWRLQKQDTRESGRPFVLPGGPWIPVITCAALLLILMALERPEWKAIGYALLVVIVLYWVARWRRASK